jgi:hypothetical protein
MRNRVANLTDLPDLLFKTRSVVTSSRLASRGGNQGCTRMDTDREATTKHTKGTKGIEVPRHDPL